RDGAGRRRRRTDRPDEARPDPGKAFAAEGQPPSLGRDFSRFPSDLNRRVRTRMLGGVGRAVSDDRPYPMYARHGRELMGWKSPVGGSPSCIARYLKLTTSPRQGRHREVGSEGSRRRYGEARNTNAKAGSTPSGP